MSPSSHSAHSAHSAQGPWLSAEDISSLYAVAPATLALYSARGTLPSYVDAAGARLFHVESAASIFRRRGAPPLETPRGHLGRLGATALGEAPIEGLPLPAAARLTAHGR
jgi:hypothetical protein